MPVTAVLFCCSPAILDYIPVDTSITFSPVSTGFPFSITIIDDPIFEGEESFVLFLSSPSPRVNFNTQFVMLTILDDDCKLACACTIQTISALLMACLCMGLTAIANTMCMYKFIEGIVYINAGYGFHFDLSRSHWSY